MQQHRHRRFKVTYYYYYLSIMHLYQKTSPFDVEYDRDVSMICEEAYLDKCLPVPVLLVLLVLLPPWLCTDC